MAKNKKMYQKALNTVKLGLYTDSGHKSEETQKSKNCENFKNQFLTPNEKVAIFRSQSGMFKKFSDE